MLRRLDQKLARIRAGAYTRADFIIADAKDPDMGPGLTGAGPARHADGTWSRYRTRAEFLDNILQVVEQDIVDIMLVSASNLERLHQSRVFEGSAVKAAIRANDASDIWVGRGAAYKTHPSRPFRTASLRHCKALTDLGLYSMTFNNNLERDMASLEAFAQFRADAEAQEFGYFLEVFNPNVATGIAPELAPAYVNDCILRCLAGLTQAERPQFLKIAFNGPAALEELASFDTTLIVGVLGGAAGTTRDCFELIRQAEKYGARVALFGRRINLAESPLDMIRFMRAVADDAMQPAAAVAAYHDALRKAGIAPARDLAADSAITEATLKHG